ncbi:MAG TPA: tripartite tricarboxylate transporter substrate binding protein [Reyranella sp.]|nr:tripartite tricarboxylate transporter substrate binding protein [Reyranella sp.]
MNYLKRRSVLGGMLGAGAWPAGAGAAGWPAKPVQWIVPYPPGGGSDTFARPIAADLTHRLGQSMLIDNRSGAAGTVGTALAARSAPDGYTLLLGDTGLVYAPAIYPKAGFDFGRDFAPVSALARAPYALVVNPQRVEAPTLAAFLAGAKARPDSVDFGSPGLGSIAHLAIDLLEDRTGTKFNHVPYRGGAPMLQDLLAGQIAAAFVLASAVAGHVKTGKLRALAVANRRREAVLPDVPTTAEAGLDDFRVTIWFGVFAPRRTPAAILDRAHDAIQAALETDEVKRVWREQSARVELESRADFARFIDREIQRWTARARAANVQME